MALAFVMCGCGSPEVINTYRVDTLFYDIIEIDNCEYLRSGNQFSHKGNCKFCAERRKKEQEELISKIKEQ